jgi:transcriptional regulator with XRE-family HTH domain
MARPSKHSKHSRPVNGKVLYETRKRLGLTPAQVDVQTKAGGHQIDDSYLSKLELGKIRHPHARVFEVLAKVYKLTPAKMCAPCTVCGEDWTAACIDHPAGSETRQPEAASAQSGAAA